jgi:hypothetical protein
MSPKKKDKLKPGDLIYYVAPCTVDGKMLYESHLLTDDMKINGSYVRHFGNDSLHFSKKGALKKVKQILDERRLDTGNIDGIRNLLRSITQYKQEKKELKNETV